LKYGATVTELIRAVSVCPLETLRIAHYRSFSHYLVRKHEKIKMTSSVVCRTKLNKMHYSLSSVSCIVTETLSLVYKHFSCDFKV
jgi:hypothetical protein